MIDSNFIKTKLDLLLKDALTVVMPVEHKYKEECEENTELPKSFYCIVVKEDVSVDLWIA